MNDIEMIALGGFGIFVVVMAGLVYVMTRGDNRDD